jgi:tRNA:m4X modification enzyme
MLFESCLKKNTHTHMFKGKLTYWLAQLIKDHKNSSVLLIDRSSHRHKRDNKLKNEKFEISVRRVCADIGDVSLSRIPEVNDVPCKVAIAKHICGAATGKLQIDWN